VILAQAQERALSVSLRDVEAQLAWMETLLGWTYRGVLVSFDDDLGEKSRWVVGRLVQLWVVTEECRTPHLRGYGPITPEMAEQVDPAARRLGDLLLDMQRIAHSTSGAATGHRDGTR